MFCMFPNSKSEWKKWATGQSFIRKEITSYRIGTLAATNVQRYALKSISNETYYAYKTYRDLIVT